MEEWTETETEQGYDYAEKMLRFTAVLGYGWDGIGIAGRGGGGCPRE